MKYNFKNYQNKMYEDTYLRNLLYKVIFALGVFLVTLMWVTLIYKGV